MDLLCAPRWHREMVSSLFLPSLPASSLKGAGSWGLKCARPTRPFGGRAFREHLPSVRVPRAGGRPGYPVSLLFEQLPNPRLNLVQPLAQVGLKSIGLGLHHHTLGLELVLEHHQLGEQLLLR